MSIATTLGETRGQRLIVDSIAVAGLAAEHLEIIALDRVQALNARLQGVLGENFLKNFDFLIDYEQRSLFLDLTSSLGDTLAGERLSFLHFGTVDSKPTRDRVVIKLKVPSFLGKPLLFLVDSRTAMAMLYPVPGPLAWRAMENTEQVGIADLSGRRDCRFQKATFEIGSSTFRGLDLAACEGLTRNKVDTDGLLPTRAFNQFFISHRGGYVIANPRRLDKLGESSEQLARPK
jgi:hypothetical protein